MSDKIEVYKEQVHGLVDLIYDTMVGSIRLSKAKRVCVEARSYGVQVVGDYKQVVLTLDDTWLTHQLIYYPDREIIELRGEDVFILRSLVKGGCNYHKLTRCLDDLISVIERWHDALL